MADGMGDGIIGDLGKRLVASAVDAVGREAARRGAEAKGPGDYDGFESLMDEALDTLAGSGADAAGRALVGIKARLSGRPEAFDLPHYRAWIGDARSRRIVKDCVREAYGAQNGERLEAHVAALVELFAEITGERGENARRPAQDAVSFVLQSIDRDLKPRDHALIGILSARIKAQAAAPLPVTTGQPSAETLERLGRDLAMRLSTLERSLGFAEAWQPEADPFAALAREALAPGSAPDGIRRRVLLWATRSAALRGALAEAEAFFGAALALDGPPDATPAEARLLQARGDVGGAIRLLRDRRDPDAASTLLDLLRRERGNAWLLDEEANGRCRPADLTPTGLLTVAQALSEAGEDERLGAFLAGASAEQTGALPLLLYLRALNHLALVLPPPDRHLLRDGNLPFDLGPLARAALDPMGPARQELCGHLDACLSDLDRLSALLDELGLRATREHARVVRLAAAAMHPDRQAEARRDLEGYLSRPGEALLYIPHAAAFLPDYDLSPVRAYLVEREALGGLDETELRAALALALRSSPRDLVAFLARHRGALERGLGAAGIASVEIQALAAAGDAPSARILFDARASTLDANTAAALDTLIAVAEGQDPIAAQISLYERTRDLETLRALVSLLVRRGDTLAIARYGRLLFDRTGSLADARAAARAMAAADAKDEFRRFVKLVPSVVEHDRELKVYHAMDLVLGGQLREAKLLVGELRAGRSGSGLDGEPIGPGSPEFDLEVVVAIDTGDWEGLARPLGEVLEQRDRLSGGALIQAASLARTAGLPIAKPLIDAAVAQAPDDAGVLVGAHGLVLEIGAEEEYREEALDWLRRALELSGEGGPIQSFSLRQLLHQEREWQRHAGEVNDMIVGGELPLAVAAPALRLTLTHVVLRHLVRNTRLDDARERVAVPLFPGNRTAPVPLPEGTRLGLDISAVLTLGHLGLLRNVIEHYPRPLVAAGVMRHLFQDRQRMLHHQRSRVERARRLQTLLATPNGIAVLDGSAAPGPANAAHDLGRELADLLAAGRRSRGVVVRPAPVHLVGSAGEAAADLTAESAHLCDTHALLRVLAGTGRLDERTETAARRFLELQDEGWGTSADPNPAAPLYLDGLTVEYLLTLGLLGDVVATFKEVYVHETVRDEVSALLAQEDLGEEVVAAIDRVRRVLKDGFDRGAVEFGPHRPEPDVDRDAAARGMVRSAPRRRKDDALEDPPLMHLLSALDRINVLVVDDRSVAGLGAATDEAGGTAPIVTTLDLVDALREMGALDDGEWRRHRFALRRAGAALVPVTAEEILAAAHRGAAREAPELRAIRDSIALARLRELPRFPAEIPWFVGVCTSAIKAVQRAFAEFPAERAPEVAQRCYGLLPDPADWLPLWRHWDSVPTAWVEAVDRALHQSLATALELAAGPARAGFEAWLEGEVLQPMRSEEPGRYARLVEGLRKLLAEAEEDDDP